MLIRGCKEPFNQVRLNVRTKNNSVRILKFCNPFSASRFQKQCMRVIMTAEQKGTERNLCMRNYRYNNKCLNNYYELNT